MACGETLRLKRHSERMFRYSYRLELQGPHQSPLATFATLKFSCALAVGDPCPRFYEIT